VSGASPVREAASDEFAGRVALVTGSSRGIGRASALRLARAGATIVLNHRRDTGPAIADAENTLRELQRLGAEVLLVRADVAVPREVQNLFARIADAFGRLDVLVNNAALTVRKRLLEMEPEDWDLVLRTNVAGAMLCMRHAVGLMEGRPGRIVNVSSLGSRIHFVSGYGGLGAAKAALETLTMELQVELDDDGHDIVVNSVCPGVVDTASFWFFERHGHIELDYERYLVDPDEVARLVMFLCGPQELVRGQTVVADRGMTLRLGPPDSSKSSDAESI
jgi:enoyl-[acyl-carrier protein] reductase III